MILVVEFGSAGPAGQVVADTRIIATGPKQPPVQTVRFGEVHPKSAQSTDAVLIANVSASESVNRSAQVEESTVVGEEALESLGGFFDEELARIIGEIGGRLGDRLTFADTTAKGLTIFESIPVRVE